MAYEIFQIRGAVGVALILTGLGSSGTAYISMKNDPVDVASIVIAPAPGTPRPPFRFSEADQKLLDEIQHGAFNYLWNAVAPETGMVRDRTSKPVVSVAGVGFQLSALPIGVERGWVTRDEARARAELILKSLSGNPGNRKAGLFYHFLDGATAGSDVEAYEHVVSTIDSALLFSGVITAGSYFGGETKRIGDELLVAADWSFFTAGPDAVVDGKVKSHEKSFMSLAWKPDVRQEPGGKGKLVPYFWLDAGDEQKLTVFLGVAAAKPEHRVPAEMYYKLRRQLGKWGDEEPFVWFPFSGALFTNFFAHCWINYGAIGTDDPSKFTQWPRARVDWWENSRRAVRMHQVKTRAKRELFPGLGEHAWGLTASDVDRGYAVPGLFPSRVGGKHEVVERDYSSFTARDDFGDGTLAPYGAGSAIMFDPGAAVAALRAYREIKDETGKPLVWREPADGGFGFADSFNAGTRWVSPDCLAIDQGPLILAIENARTGLIWKLFTSSETAKAGFERLGLKVSANDKNAIH